MTRPDRVRPFVSACIRSLSILAGVCLLPVFVAAQTVGPPYASGRDSDPRDLPPATAVDWSDDVPAHVAVVDGSAQLEREGVAEALDENMPLLAGDRIRTDRGRVEVRFADGSLLDVDEYTSITFLSDTLLRMDSGRLRLLIARGDGDASYRVDAAGVIARIRAAGEYRVAIVGDRNPEPELRLGVLRGAAELESPFGRTAVRPGDEAATSARTAPSLPYATIASSRDSFDRWIDAQYADRVGTRSISAQYLPADLRTYGNTFDRDGSWIYEPAYGYVWYPRVDSTWQPYYDGRWTFAGAFGWTWVGAGRWTWPTHHYGRWGNASGRWYWIPDRRWAPAWVAWGSSPGYVSWCPLGYDNRAVIALATITSYNSGYAGGWTVVPSRAFGRGVAVRSQAVSTRSLAPTERFTLRGSGPSRPVSARADIQPLRGPSFASRSSAVPRAAERPVGRVAPAPSSPPAASMSGRSRAGADNRPTPPVASRQPRQQENDAPQQPAWPTRSRVAAPRQTPDSPSVPMLPALPSRPESPSGRSGERVGPAARARDTDTRSDPAPRATRPYERRPVTPDSRPGLPASPSPQPEPSNQPMRGVGRRPSEAPRQEPAPRREREAGPAAPQHRGGGLPVPAERGQAQGRERR